MGKSYLSPPRDTGVSSRDNIGGGKSGSLAIDHGIWSHPKSGRRTIGGGSSSAIGIGVCLPPVSLDKILLSEPETT